MRMKCLTLLFIMLIAGSSISANPKDGWDEIIFSQGGCLPFVDNIKVIIQENTVTTTFLKDVRNATIIVKKKSGEVIQKESLDAKTFDQVPVKIDNYQKGNYTIEIEAEGGKAEGEF